MFLLDTNIVSDATKPQPDAGLLRWMQETPAQHMFLSVITIGEITRGIAKHGTSKRGLEL
jgi:toxin FitB